jgi:hypothetical protein
VLQMNNNRRTVTAEMTVKRKLEQTLRLPKQKKGKRMSILRNGSMISASKLRAL